MANPAPTNDNLLAARGLARDYNASRAVDDIDLSLKPGDVVGVLGPNGAGKTTILRMLAGSLAPSAGSIAIAGYDLARYPRRAKQNLGYLPERPPVYPELTVDEYLGFAARLRNIPRRQRRSAIESAKNDCGLADVGRRLIGALSKGYAQRVGLAQAIVHRPRLLILDEPTAGLDPNQRVGVRDLITRLSAQHSVIVSSHILGEIQAVATRVVIVDRGRIALDLDRTMLAADNGWFELGLDRDPGIQAIADLPGVIEVRHAPSGHWLIRAESEHPIRQAVARHAVIHDWGLHTLAARPTSLEERFMYVTGGAIL